MARSRVQRDGAGALGTLLRQRRKSLGLTARRVARLAEVSPSYVSHLERGHSDRPSLDVLARLSQALDLPLSEVCVAVLPAPPAVTPSVASTLAAVAAEYALDATALAMLGAIHWEGRQPSTADGWRLVLLAIRAACAGDAASGRITA